MRLRYASPRLRRPATRGVPESVSDPAILHVAKIGQERTFSLRRKTLLYFPRHLLRSAVNLSTMDRLIPQWERDLKVKGEAREKKSGLLGILAGDDKWCAHQPENAGVLADSADWIKPLSITSTRYAPHSVEHSTGDSCVGTLKRIALKTRFSALRLLSFVTSFCGSSLIHR